MKNEMKKIRTSILAILLFSFLLSLPAIASEEPTIPIGKAIEKATKYISSTNIDISKHYIASAEYHIRFGLLSFWKIEWKLKKLTKGGQIYVQLYTDGKIEHMYGE